VSRENTDISESDIVWLYRQKIVIFMHVIGMAIALLAPIDQISSGTFIASIVDGVLNVIPMGRNFSVRSNIPELVRLQAAVMVFYIPILISVYLKCPDFKGAQRRMLKIIAKSKIKLCFLHAYFIFVAASLFICLFVVEGTEFATFPFLTSRFFLGVFGPVIFALTPAFTTCWFFIIFLVLIKFWRNEDV
jgi:hypothetical protein